MTSLIQKLQDADGGSRELDNAFDRFFEKVEKTPNCWNWTGATRGSRQKRGCFWNGKKNECACRWIFRVSNPKIRIEGMVVRHKCDNPLCVNPDHLEIGTQAENVRDMFERGRNNIYGVRRGARIGRKTLAENPELRARGERHGSSKLSERSVLIIYASPEKTSLLAKQYGVCRTTIQKIRNGKLWGHVTKETAALRARHENEE